MLGIQGFTRLLLDIYSLNLAKIHNYLLPLFITDKLRIGLFKTWNA